jgi:hypothetical protein
MTDEVVSQQSEAQNSDSGADAFAAIATVCLFVVTVLFWLSHQ